MKDEKRIGKLVGRIGEYYYICDTIFNHNDGLKGATATILRAVPQAEYGCRIDPENSDTLDRFEDYWIEQVKAGQTKDSLKDWVEFVLSTDGDEAVFDMSGYEYWDMLREGGLGLTEEDYPVFECVGGGRAFSKNMEFDEVFDKTVLAEIREIEE